MNNKLKQYFPMIYERENLLYTIRSNPLLKQKFDGWEADQQTEFLDFCTGVKGVKLLYDSFFKEILNPEYTPDRLNALLSALLGTQATIKFVLPGDSTRIADEGSLLIMDILVELDDGSLVNVEVQKVGYTFPGQRSACYSADLLLRQYKRARDRKKKKFSYEDIKGVFTIVLIEHSTEEFKKFPTEYLHYFEQHSNTGLKIDLLQKYLFIPLDIFSQTIQNKDISTETDAWLTFLSQDDPEIIVRLIEAYPEFRLMYEDVYRLCQNVERVMEMFSEELRILDRNTVRYMIDEMQVELKDANAQLESTNAQLREKEQENEQLKKRIAELEKQSQK